MDAHTPMSRRRLLKVGTALALTSGVWPGALAAADVAAGAFSFVVLNDLHYADGGCVPYFERLMRTINATNADFVLIAGDLVGYGCSEQIGAMREILQTLRKPFYVVPGNHDYIDKNNRKYYDQAFANSVNFTFEHKGWQVLGLDTTNGTAVNASAPDDTLKFIDATLAKIDRSRPVLALTHFPLGENVPYRLGNAEVFLQRFREHNLVTVFSGHFHGISERQAGKVALVTNRCCSYKRGNHDKTKEKGFYLCRAGNGVIERRFVEFKPKLG